MPAPARSGLSRQHGAGQYLRACPVGRHCVPGQFDGPAPGRLAACTGAARCWATTMAVPGLRLLPRTRAALSNTVAGKRRAGTLSGDAGTEWPTLAVCARTAASRPRRRRRRTLGADFQLLRAGNQSTNACAMRLYPSPPTCCNRTSRQPPCATGWQLPPGYNPRTLELAAQLRRQAADSRADNGAYSRTDKLATDHALVNAVLQMFREQSFSYTLSPPLLGRDAVDEFLFSTRAGFCEHYAGAFVVLMRALDIPARVVTGYQGGEINPVDGYVTVRQSDAHAWAEVWLPRHGWVTDRSDRGRRAGSGRAQPGRCRGPCPARRPGEFFRQSPIPGSPACKAARHGWEAVNNAWNQWVLDYSPARQRSLIAIAGLCQRRLAHPGRA